jgi:BNR/Asp-box repeat
MKLKRVVAPVVVATVSMLLAVGPAGANTYLVTGPTLASGGATPFRAGCGGPGEGFHTPTEVAGVNFPNTEIEPWFQVNPQDPNDLVGFWQQDRWSDGGAHGLVAGVSTDGGASWSKSWPAFSNCAGGTQANGGGYERSSDPWVSWASTPANGLGALHAISISFDRSTAHNAVLTSRSLDGGHSWSSPITLREDNSNSGPLANLFNDKESITADPVTAGYIYAVWDRIESPNNNPLTPPQAYAHAPAFRGPAWFARSTDNGASWETAHPIFAPAAGRTQTIGNQIVVLPNGTLVDGFNYIRGSNGQGIQRGDNAAVIFSTDHGITWSSEPTIIANMGDTGVRDPQPVNCLGDNTPSTPCLLVRTGDILPDFAVDAHSGSPGTMYAVWQSHRTATVAGNPVDDTILISRSTDGGHVWSPPVKVNQTPSGVQAFTASVHVAANGDVAVTYYDFRNDASGDAALSTDYWIVHHHAADPFDSAHFNEESRLTPASFNMRTAPYAGGYFVGDYEGLDSFGNTITPFFVQATGTDPFHQLTDAFYSTAAGS